MDITSKQKLKQWHHNIFKKVNKNFMTKAKVSLGGIDKKNLAKIIKILYPI
jgi:hypothetical protein